MLNLVIFQGLTDVFPDFFVRQHCKKNWRSAYVAHFQNFKLPTVSSIGLCNKLNSNNCLLTTSYSRVYNGLSLTCHIVLVSCHIIDRYSHTHVDSASHDRPLLPSALTRCDVSSTAWPCEGRDVPPNAWVACFRPSTQCKHSRSTTVTADAEKKLTGLENRILASMLGLVFSSRVAESYSVNVFAEFEYYFWLRPLSSLLIIRSRSYYLYAQRVLRILDCNWSKRRRAEFWSLSCRGWVLRSLLVALPSCQTRHKHTQEDNMPYWLQSVNPMVKVPYKQ